MKRTVKCVAERTTEYSHEPLLDLCAPSNPPSLPIISGFRDKTIRIWVAETGIAVGKPLKWHTDNVLSVAYSPNGCYIICKVPVFCLGSLM